ncbi:tubulin-like doman-containing protein [Thermococcus sp.]|uniref:tubulin-like doman-containing protein n=1 Tax=Thermococcus sp. TaxID=35749 RepID=UPI0026217795|nr:tubulin-like doman-containing protein [Thermococcus sp.]
MVELRVFPDVIMGIGGAGKNLVFQMLRTEWLVRALLENSEKKYTFIILDTAVGEMKDDLAHKEEIDAFIEKIAEEMNKPKNIDVEVRNIIQDLHIDTPRVLYTKNLIDELHRKKLVKVWWILDKKHGVDNTEALQKYGSSGFSKGTIRRRGVTKAMFYKALVEGRVDEIFSIKPGAQEIAMVVGLGGGTGSGIFIDLAQRIRDSNPGVTITLFGILPSLEEGEEKANAYIALSELEYLRLTQGKFGEVLFNHVVLSTIQPTRFRGSDDAYAKNIALQEFSEAFVYTFVNFYDAKSGNQSDEIEPNHYGRFTLMTSGIVRYEVESTVSNKKDLDEAVTAFTKALKVEEDIREKDIEGIIGLLKEAEMIEPSGGDGSFYSRYLDYIKNTRLIQEFYGFLTNPVLMAFNYNSPKAVMDEINTRILMGDQKFSDVVNGLKTPEEILDFINQLKTAIESAKTDFRDDVDKKIYETFVKILDNIHLSIEQLAVLHRFRFPENLKKSYEPYETEIGTALRDLATFEAKPVVLNRIDDLRRAVGNDIASRERRLSEIEEELKALEKEKAKIENDVEEIIEINTKLLRNYYRFIKDLPEIEGLIREASRKIQRVLDDLKTHALGDIDKNLEPEMLARQVSEDMESALEGLKNLVTKLEAIFPGNPEVLTLKDLIDYIDLIKETLLNYYGYRYYEWRQENRSLGERLRGKDYSVEMEDYLDRYEKAYSRVSRRKELSSFIRIRPGAEPNTISNVEINRLDESIWIIIKKLRDSIQDSITAKIGKRLNVDLKDIQLDKVASESKSQQEFISKAKNAIYEAILAKTGVGSKLNELIEEKKKLEAEIEELSKFQGLLGTLRERIVDVRSRLQKEWKEYKNRYDETMKKLKKYLEKTSSRRNEKGTFIYKVQPSPEALGLLMDASEGSLAKILQNPSLNTISQNEFNKILNTFRELLQTLIIPEYSGVDKYRRIVEGEDGIPIEWKLKSVLSYINSPVNENTGEVTEKLREVVMETLERTVKPRKVVPTGMPARGSPWDIAITIIFPKVFLEDIYGLYQKNNSYYDEYYSLNQSGKKREIFHHVYKLEDGWYIAREPMDFDEAIILASDEQYNNRDVSEEILNKYYIKHNVANKGPEGSE